MKTYKIGNKCQCIVRAYVSGKIGNEEILYNGQPYCIISDCEAEVIFSNTVTPSTAGKTILQNSTSFIDEIRLSNCLITSKILNLIFQKTEDKLLTSTKVLYSDDEKKIFLPISQEEAYQVFIYKDGELENAYGSVDTSSPIEVQHPNSKYTIIYSYLNEDKLCCALNMPNNVYLSLDLNLIGNEEDESEPMFMHIDKCSISSNKNLTFNRQLNTVNLTFKVMHDGDTTKSYLVL